MIDEQLRGALAACAAADPLMVACDYDGTLSPLVDDPSKAIPHDPALDALVQLGGMSGVDAFMISGRSLATLRELSGDPQSVTLIGTHGAEIEDGVSRHDLGEAAQRLIGDLRSVAADNPGTLLEEKTIGAALHYRHAVDPEAAVTAVRSAAERHGARVIEGKLVLEVLLGDADKGTALAQVRRRIAAEALLFIGDDTTDEDVFVTLGPDDVGVKVGEGPTAARHRVADPAGVAEVLSSLARFRQSSSG